MRIYLTTPTIKNQARRSEAIAAERRRLRARAEESHERLLCAIYRLEQKDNLKWWEQCKLDFLRGRASA